MEPKPPEELERTTGTMESSGTLSESESVKCVIDDSRSSLKERGWVRRELRERRELERFCIDKPEEGRVYTIPPFPLVLVVCIFFTVG